MITNRIRLLAFLGALIFICAPLKSHALDYTTKGESESVQENGNSSNNTDIERKLFNSRKELKEIEEKKRKKIQEQKKAKSKKQKAIKNKSACTVEDKKFIEKYDRIFERKIEDFKKASEVSPENDREVKSLQRDFERFQKFLDSEEYKKLIDLYRKCDIEHPEIPAPIPFWME